ncbi:hypothetical protein CMI45_01845 [Candidatus Pacearchaeota archaeon]|nr:hypothetical protein [Candidatus Pacearchaeota archaeon]|tara:strand:+ start:1824 stop:2018 length:195 start_codon:yes stop_codon:yes gene_type:complete
MKREKRGIEEVKRKDIYALLAFFLGFYVSLNFIDNLTGWLLGITFLVAFLYGAVSVYRGEKFIF